LEKQQNMTELNDKTIEVLIVGAGPTGLMMACQLAIHHISFRIIDKNELSSKNSGALIVQARSLEIFEQMWIANEAIKEGIIPNKLNILFDGKKITSSHIKNIGENLSRFPFLLMLEQSKTEKILLKYISDKGFSVERNTRFKSFIQDKDGVTSEVILSNGLTQTIRSKYIVAADGANSTIRNMLNIPFKGKTYKKPIFILDCEAKTEMLSDEISIAFSKSNVAGFFPLPGFRWRIDSNLPNELEKKGKIAFKDIQSDFPDWTKMNIAIQSDEWFSVTRSHQKYADTIRITNCFLAGDAAHLNTPVGAQGMNTGLQDAYNLAWKLAFVIKNKAKPELLETYSTERLGISKGFARYSDKVFKLVTSQNVMVKILRTYVLKLLFKFLFPIVDKQNAFRQKFFKSISQIGINYRKSSLSYQLSDGSFSKGVPKPGDRLPYIQFLLKERIVDIYEFIDTSSFNLLVLTHSLPDDLRKIADTYHLKVTIIAQQLETKELYTRLGIINTGYYLVLPDMYIAFRSSNMNIQHLNSYLQSFMQVSRYISFKIVKET
jgi:2-polyprenyl-6-methoxyphenol hydroxylase-like FAD-dependent oxidoreductase